MQSSTDIPAGIKTQFSKLLKTDTNLKIHFLGFGKSAKLGIDLKSSCAENACTSDGVGMDSFAPKTNRFFIVKLNIVEEQLVSLLTRDNFSGANRDGDQAWNLISMSPSGRVLLVLGCLIQIFW